MILNELLDKYWTLNVIKNDSKMIFIIFTGESGTEYAVKVTKNKEKIRTYRINRPKEQGSLVLKNPHLSGNVTFGTLIRDNQGKPITGPGGISYRQTNLKEEALVISSVAKAVLFAATQDDFTCFDWTPAYPNLKKAYDILSMLFEKRGNYIQLAPGETHYVMLKKEIFNKWKEAVANKQNASS